MDATKMGCLAPIYCIDDYSCEMTAEMAVVPPSVAGRRKCLQCVSTPANCIGGWAACACESQRLRHTVRAPARIPHGISFWAAIRRLDTKPASSFTPCRHPLPRLNRAEWKGVGRVEACGRPAPLWRSPNEPWRICR